VTLAWASGSPPSMLVSYAAHTKSFTFFLDEDGVCERVESHPPDDEAPDSKLRTMAARCVGAQYVASIDPDEEGGLAKLPRVGKPLVFAYMTDAGRIVLLRTGALVHFETRQAHDSGVRHLPSQDYEVIDDDQAITRPIFDEETLDAPIDDFTDEPTNPQSTPFSRPFHVSRPAPQPPITLPQVMPRPMTPANTFSPATPDRNLPPTERRIVTPPPPPPRPRSSPPPPLVRPSGPPPVPRKVTVFRAPDSSGPTERRPAPGEWRMVPKGILPRRNAR
jgi:hypothetical protein